MIVSGTSGRVAALMIFLLIAAGSSALAPVGAIEAQTTDTEPASYSETDTEAMARGFGISVAQLSEQTGYQDRLRQIPFREYDPGFVETRSELGAQYGIKYLTTSTNPERALEQLRSAGLAQFVEVVRVPRPLDKLEAALVKVASHRDEFPSDLSIDTFQGRIIARVVELPSNARQSEIAAEAGAPIDWRQVESLSEDYTGGGRPFDSLGCTGGFVVERLTTLVRGLSTAAHCVSSGGNFSYQNVILSLNSFKQQGKADVAYLTNPSVTWEPKVYMGQDGLGIRDVNSKIARGDILIGDGACKFGKTTQYTCGTVTSKSECPSTIPSCLNTWLRIDKQPFYTSMANNGDSGGPVMWNNAAMAIVQGGPTVTNPSYMYAMAVSLFDDELSVRVITTP